MKNILRNTWAILEREEKKRFSILIVLDIIISILDILALVLLLWIIQFYIQPGMLTRLSFLPDWLADKDSLVFIAVFFFLFGLKNVAGFFISRAQYRFLSRVAIRISQHNLSHYQRSEFQEFINIDSSVHIRRICLQPFEFCQYILSGIQQGITQVSLITIAITAILIFNATLFLLLLIMLLPPVFFLFYFMKKRLDKAKKQIRTSNESSFRYVLDALKGYIESNIYDRNEFFMQRFLLARKKFSASLFESISIQSMPSRIIEIFAVLGLFILIAIAKWTGHNDSAALLTIGAFMAAAYKIIPGIVKLVNISGQMRAYEFSVKDILPATTQQKNDHKNIPATINSLEFKNLGFQYADQKILENVSFRLQKGDLLGISGRSGKGKTTILNLLLGFLTPAKDTIFINDLPIDPATLQAYWPQIAYVRQQPFFIHDTLLRNITLEEEHYDKAKLAYALKVSGLEELLKNIPEGLDKIITENGKNISGGQQQRVTIARALYKDAPVILLDEPFNELDEASVLSLLGHFKELVRAGKMIILITHDSKSLSYCDKTISLDE